MAQEIIYLNIGGTKYATTIETLTKEPSRLADIVKKQIKNKYERKEVFIDRNGSMFHYILEYLRNKDNASWDALWPESNAERKQLQIEAAFYGFENFAATGDELINIDPIFVIGNMVRIQIEPWPPEALQQCQHGDFFKESLESVVDMKLIRSLEDWVGVVVENASEKAHADKCAVVKFSEILIDKREMQTAPNTFILHLPERLLMGL